MARGRVSVLNGCRCCDWEAVSAKGGAVGEPNPSMSLSKLAVFEKKSTGWEKFYKPNFGLYKPNFGLYKPSFELHKPNLELYKPNLGL